MAVFFADFTTKWTSCRSNFFHVLPSPININWILEKGCQSEVLFLLRAYAFNDIINKKSRPGEVGRGISWAAEAGLSPHLGLTPYDGWVTLWKAESVRRRLVRVPLALLRVLLFSPRYHPLSGGCPKQLRSMSWAPLLPSILPYDDPLKEACAHILYRIHRKRDK